MTNLVILDGDPQTVPVGFDAEVRDNGATAEVVVNDATTLDFADGTATADITTASGGPTVTVDGQAVPVSDEDGNTVEPRGIAAGLNPEPLDAPQAELNVTFGSRPELDGHEADFRQALQTAWSNWMRLFDEDTSARVNIEVEFARDPAVSATGHATETQDTGRDTADGADVFRADAVVKLDPSANLIGNDPPDEIDGTVTIATTPDEWDFGPGTAKDKIDAESVLMHELGHILGVSTFPAHQQDAFRAPWSTYLENGSFQTAKGLSPDSITVIDGLDGEPIHLADGLGIMSVVPAFDTVSEKITAVDVAVMETIGLPVREETLDGISEAVG